MKNEWNLFDTVHRQLAAGRQLVTFRRFTVPTHSPTSSSGQSLAYDEAGEEYVIGAEFVEALNACIRELRISWSMEREGEFYQVYKFGPDLNRAAEPEPTDPQVKTINLLELDPNDPETAKIFEDVRRHITGEDEEDEDGEEWKRLLE